MPQRDPAVDTATARNLIFNAAAHSTDDAADERLQTDRVEIDLIKPRDEDEHLLTPGVDSKGHRRQEQFLSRLSSQAQQILSPGLSSSAGTLASRRPSRANARNACTLLLVGLTFFGDVAARRRGRAKGDGPAGAVCGPREVAFVEHPHISSERRAAPSGGRRRWSNAWRRRRRRGRMAPAAATPPIAAVTPPIAAPRADRRRRGVRRRRAAAGRARRLLVLVDGSNEGEAVDLPEATSSRCATPAPDRVYHARWPSMSKAERRAAMAPLNEAARWCVRTFEAAPELLPPLRDRERGWRGKGFDVRVVGGALANASAARTRKCTGTAAARAP